MLYAACNSVAREPHGTVRELAGLPNLGLVQF